MDPQLKTDRKLHVRIMFDWKISQLQMDPLSQNNAYAHLIRPNWKASDCRTPHAHAHTHTHAFKQRAAKLPTKFTLTWNHARESVVHHCTGNKAFSCSCCLRSRSRQAHAHVSFISTTTKPLALTFALTLTLIYLPDQKPLPNSAANTDETITPYLWLLTPTISKFVTLYYVSLGRFSGMDQSSKIFSSTSILWNIGLRPQTRPR